MGILSRVLNQSKKKSYKSNSMNDIALQLSHKLLGISYLHYGYFTETMEKGLKTLPEAQEVYANKILSEMRNSDHSVLDIGCGVGSIAVKLIQRGCKVTCVDPDPYMIETTREKTQNKIEFRNDFYENVESLGENSFDCVLMSESCQYVDPDKGWALHSKHLKGGGRVVIADFFKIKPLDKPYLSKSGHEWISFNESAKRNGFTLLRKVDITENVSPTMDIYQEIIKEKIFPVLYAFAEILKRKSPKIHWILKRLFHKKISFLFEKYSHQDGITFSKYKGYFLLIYEKIK